MTDSKQVGTLARLPTEILQAILEHLDHPLCRSTATQHKQRCSSLYAACLVSKCFYELAPPILWRQVVLPLSEATREELDGLERTITAMQAAPTSAAVRNATHTLRIYNTRSDGPTSLKGLIELFPSVEAVAVVRLEFRDFGEIAPLQRLDHLKVLGGANVRIPAASFAHLTTLDLGCVMLDRSSTGDYAFTHNTFPQLRHLSMRSCAFIAPGESDTPAFFPPLSRVFLDQLEDFQMDLADRDRVTSSTFPSFSEMETPPFLFHAEWFDEDIFAPPSGGMRATHPPVHHLQIPKLDPDAHMCSTATDVRAIVGALVLSSPALRLVLVPVDLWPPLGGFDETYGEMKRLEGEGAERSITLWAYEPKRPLDGLVVPEFKEYLRELATRAGT
ncbi:hypothetical protein JCM10449v2_003224 [Rhodotorula kratochvilovae]